MTDDPNCRPTTEWLCHLTINSQTEIDIGLGLAPQIIHEVTKEARFPISVMDLYLLSVSKLAQRLGKQFWRWGSQQVGLAYLFKQEFA